MPIQQTRFFSTDPQNARSLTGLGLVDLFNDSIIPLANQLEPEVDLDGEDALARQRRAETAAMVESTSFERRQADDTFLAARGQQDDPYSGITDYSEDLSGGLSDSTAKGPIKLSNYGYESDSSPDYNSNVLRIGHANNKLEDGLSAAVTKSLARRHGLKTGDLFEVETSDGKKMTRRYDDTVPTSYKGKPLPETVDLYELKGSNKFGGSVVGIKPLTRK